jgi:hypothetical protein
MKKLKTLLMAICLFAGFISLSQDIKNTSSDIVYKGSIYQVDKSITHITEWIEGDKNMLEMMAVAKSQMPYDPNFKSVKCM